MLGLGGLPGVILAAGMVWLPETPRWLAGHGQAEGARAALHRLRGQGADIDAELAQLSDDLTPTAQGRPDSRLGHRAARLPLIVGVGLAVFQQVTGVNTVIYFAPTIFQASGLSSASAAILATAGIGVVNVAMTVVARSGWSTASADGRSCCGGWEAWGSAYACWHWGSFSARGPRSVG